MAGNLSWSRRSRPLLSNFLDLANRIRTPFTPNRDFKITTLKLDYLNFSTMQRDKRQSCKQFAMPTLRLIYAAEGKTLRTLLVWRELMRDEPEYVGSHESGEPLSAKVRLSEARRRPSPSPRRPPSKPSKMSPKQHSRSSKIHLSPRPARQGTGEWWAH